MSILPADVFVSATLAGKNVLGVCVHVCARVCQHLLCMQVFVSVCD